MRAYFCKTFHSQQVLSLTLIMAHIISTGNSGMKTTWQPCWIVS